jgi:hypothetical protein
MDQYLLSLRIRQNHHAADAAAGVADPAAPYRMRRAGLKR